MTEKKRGWIKPAVLTLVLATAGGLGVAAAKSNDWGHGDCGRHGGFVHGGKGWFSPGRHTEGKLAFLEAELQITEGQEEAWKAFADVVRQADQARADMRESRRERRQELLEEQDRPPLDQRIDRHLQNMEQGMTTFRELATAAKTLYAALTPEQQEIADRMMPRVHGRHMRF